VEPEESVLAPTDILPGRLWAAVDVKETPTEYVLSTDVRPRRRKTPLACVCKALHNAASAPADQPRACRCRACARMT